MKKFLLISLAAAALFVGASATSAVAGQLTVTNRTEYPFIRFYARNRNIDELWSATFRDNPIYPGETRTFTFRTRGLCDDWNIEVDREPNHMTKGWDVSVCGGGHWRVGMDVVDNADGQESLVTDMSSNNE